MQGETRKREYYLYDENFEVKGRDWGSARSLHLSIDM